MNFKLDSTITKQERTVYDSFELAGDLGGLNEIIFLVLTPLVGLFIGSSYYFSLFHHLFWVKTAEGVDLGSEQ